MIKTCHAYTPVIPGYIPMPAMQDCLLFDIETTGLSYAHSHIYLIGCAFYENGTWQLCQLFAEKSSEEFAVLEAFLQLTERFRRFVTFNGAGFDLPYLEKKCTAYLLQSETLHKPMTDLYRTLSPYKGWFGLSQFKQKDAERFMGVYREDPYSGRELISVYRQYQRGDASVKEALQSALLLHNAEDIKGMHACIGMLSYLQPFSRDRCLYTKGASDGALYRFYFQLDDPVPKPFTLESEDGALFLDGKSMIVCLPVVEGALRYYHADYRQYVRLPEERLLVPKAFAKATGRKHAIPATLSDCYEEIMPSPALLAPPASREEARACDAARLCHAFLQWLLACRQRAA